MEECNQIQHSISGMKGRCQITQVWSGRGKGILLTVRLLVELFIYLFIYLFIVIYLDWVGQLQFDMYSTLAPKILK